MPTTENTLVHGFAFLDRHHPDLRTFLEAAERQIAEPRYAALDVRNFIELMLLKIAERAGITRQQQETLVQFINRLRDQQHIPKWEADLFHRIRLAANPIIHSEVLGRKGVMRLAVAEAKELAYWFAGVDPHQDIRQTELVTVAQPIDPMPRIAPETIPVVQAGPLVPADAVFESLPIQKTDLKKNPGRQKKYQTTTEELRMSFPGGRSRAVTVERKRKIRN